MPRRLSDNGTVRPCSCPASDPGWQGGAKDKQFAMRQGSYLTAVEIA
jgi:hypothetical protein